MISINEVMPGTGVDYVMNRLGEFNHFFISYKNKDITGVKNRKIMEFNSGHWGVELSYRSMVDPAYVSNKTEDWSINFTFFMGSQTPSFDLQELGKLHRRLRDIVGRSNIKVDTRGVITMLGAPILFKQDLVNIIEIIKDLCILTTASGKRLPGSRRKRV